MKTIPKQPTPKQSKPDNETKTGERYVERNNS